MKCVCMQHIESVGRLFRKISEDETARPLRTIHVTFLPDEETGAEKYLCLLLLMKGGVDGAAHFVNSDEYKQLNIGMAFDEVMLLLFAFFDSAGSCKS